MKFFTIQAQNTCKPRLGKALALDIVHGATDEDGKNCSQRAVGARGPSSRGVEMDGREALVGRNI